MIQDKAEEKKDQLWAKDLAAEDGPEPEIAQEEKKPQNKSFLSSREEYRQQRLEKILKQKETESPTLEEIKARPGLKEIRQIKLVQSDETMRAKRSKDDYI